MSSKNRAELYLDADSMELEEFDYKGDKALKVTGVALTEGEWNKVWFGADEIKKGVQRLCPENACRNLQLRANHSKSVWDIVGSVKKFEYDESISMSDGSTKAGIRFESEVRLKEAVERVEKDLWGPVSVGVWADLHRVETNEEDEDGGKKTRIEARNLDFEHLAWVTNPACKDAGLQKVLNSMDSEETQQEEIKVSPHKEENDFIPMDEWYRSLTIEGDSTKPPENEEKKESEKIQNEEVDNKEVSEVSEEESEQSENIEANKQSEQAEQAEQVNAEDEKKDSEIEALRNVIEEQSKMINELLEVKKNEEAEVETAEQREKQENEEIDDTESKDKKRKLVEEILSLDSSESEKELMETDVKALDTLLNYLERSKEREAVPGEGVSADAEVDTLDKLNEKELTKMVIKHRGGDWALGQIIKNLWSGPKRKTTYEEI